MVIGLIHPNYGTSSDLVLNNLSTYNERLILYSMLCMLSAHGPRALKLNNSPSYQFLIVFTETWLFISNASFNCNSLRVTEQLLLTCCSRISTISSDFWDVVILFSGVNWSFPSQWYAVRRLITNYLARSSNLDLFCALPLFFGDLEVRFSCKPASCWF